MFWFLNFLIFFLPAGLISQYSVSQIHNKDNYD